MKLVSAMDLIHRQVISQRPDNKSHSGDYLGITKILPFFIDAVN